MKNIWTKSGNNFLKSQKKSQRKDDELTFISTGRENPKIQIRTIVCDFTEGHTIYSQLRKELSDLSVGLLVNNVGMKVSVNGGVADVPSGDEFRHIINCNIMSMVRMTNLLLPAMRKRRRGLIINIGSIAGTGFAIKKATYGATKVRNNI